MKVKIVPNSSRNKIEGLLDDMLKIKIAAVPEKGKANSALKKFLAEKLSLKTGQITIVTGISSPVKKVKINDIEINDFIEKIQ